MKLSKWSRRPSSPGRTASRRCITNCSGSDAPVTESCDGGARIPRAVNIGFVQEAARPQLAMNCLPFNEWVQPNQSVWAQFFKTASGYLLRFPGLADFQISADGQAIPGCPVEGTSD